MAVVAALGGAGAWLVARGAFPPPRPLHVVAAELRQPRSVAADHADSLRGRWALVARRLAGSSSPRLRADLAVVGKTAERHMLDKLGYSCAFTAIGLVPLVAFPLSGTVISPVVPLAGIVVLAGLGWAYPDVELRSKAATARRAWAHALTVFTDVVGIALAGGAGVEDALLDAAAAGAGPQLEQLAATMHAAQTRRLKLWDAIDDLGAAADISPLRELAASMSLAGESGSRVRETLAAKAAALRTRQLAEVEAEAQKASETMGVAPALMAIAAVVLIAYPAVAAFLE
jgi:Flp pilus assembly protein TadB